MENFLTSWVNIHFYYTLWTPHFVFLLVIHRCSAFGFTGRNKPECWRHPVEGSQGSLPSRYPSTTDTLKQHATGMCPPHTWWRQHAPLPRSYHSQPIISLLLYDHARPKELGAHCLRIHFVTSCSLKYTEKISPSHVLLSKYVCIKYVYMTWHDIMLYNHSIQWLVM